MIIKSKLNDYEVTIKDSLYELGSIFSIDEAIYIIDKNVYFIYEELFIQIPPKQKIILEAKEENKIIDSALMICEALVGLSAKKNAKLVAVGGGIIQDIVGFAANIIYRGIEWYFLPTTLLSCCDSCIGGKTSLNYKDFKNLLGTFYPPKKIIICLEFLKTLKDRDFESGLGEIIKFNIMEGNSKLEMLEKRIDSLLRRDNCTLKYFVESSLDYKKSIIEIDEFDKGERVKLNFAHTFGHAIETVTGYEIPHGTAVAIGTIIANYISQKRGLLDETLAKRAEAVLLKAIHINVNLTTYNEKLYIDSISKDKKQTDKSMKAILLSSSAPRLAIIDNLTSKEVIEGIAYFQRVYLKSCN